MSNIERAAEVISRHRETTPQVVAQALARAGLLAPDPAPTDILPPEPMTPRETAQHLYGLMIDDGGIFKRNDQTQPMWADRPLMLRQGDRLIPLVQAGVHQGHIFVETWDSYGPRSAQGTESDQGKR